MIVDLFCRICHVCALALVTVLIVGCWLIHVHFVECPLCVFLHGDDREFYVLMFVLNVDMSV